MEEVNLSKVSHVELRMAYEKATDILMLSIEENKSLRSKLEEKERECEELQAAGLVKQEWNDACEGLLPDYDEYVLWLNERTGNYYVESLDKDDNNNGFLSLVTHWMPLPTPPVNDNPIKD